LDFDKPFTQFGVMAIIRDERVPEKKGKESAVFSTARSSKRREHRTRELVDSTGARTSNK
jgi:hypothetical protein